MTADEVFDQIALRFKARGDQHYGENVSEKEHALQAAASAERVGSSPELVVACLLHDFGHLIHDLGENIAAAGVDAKHEDLGAHYLADYFPPAIVEPARLHVEAKRYLCTTRPEYLATLSQASRVSLELQGGLMTAEEVAEFEANPHCEAAIQLRHHDDAAKVEGAKTKSLEDYRDLVTKFISFEPQRQAFR